jgi:hypothetical protein
MNPDGTRWPWSSAQAGLMGIDTLVAIDRGIPN